MSAHPYDKVEISIDEVNDIFVVEKCDGEITNNSKQIATVDKSIKRVLNLDKQQNSLGDDKNQQRNDGQTIEGGELSGNQNQDERKAFLSDKANTYPCKDACKRLPEHPSRWPQRPLMIRPTPHSSTKVIGIRMASRHNYQEFIGFTAGCILPINNGTELEGESVVVDFESTHFVGTLMLRIKQVPPISIPRGRGDTSCKKEDQRNVGQGNRNSRRDYFANKKRKFQAIVKGRFRTPLSMSRCVTGQTFERPAGRLPARWLVKNFIKLVSIIAPQLDASLDDNKPRFLTPLVATAQTVLCEDDESEKSCDNSNDRNLCNHFPSLRYGDRHLTIDTRVDLEEPPSLEPSSVLSGLGGDSDLAISIPDTISYSVTGRSLTRKNVFNALSAKISPEPRFDVHKVYTFEFYQHLLDFGNELAVDMGRIGGMVPLANAMDGQPLKILAAYRSSELEQELDPLWSFDIFHESLYSHAEKAID